MSQLYDLYVADKSEAEDICENPCDRSDEVSVPAFWESKQLSLLSLFINIPPVSPEFCFPERYSRAFFAIYHRYFELLYPPDEIGSECYVAKFPDDLVRALAELSDDAISDVAARWLAIEPSFAANYKWTKPQVEGLLKKVCSTCHTAMAEQSPFYTDLAFEIFPDNGWSALTVKRLKNRPGFRIAQKSRK